MAKSANHHYIPKVILRNFCHSANSLYYFSRNRLSDGVKSRNFESIFKKRHLNSVRKVDGQVDDGLEKFFALNFDDPMHDFIKEVERTVVIREVFKPNWEQHYFFVQFLYNHMRRTPDFHQPIIDEVFHEHYLKEAVEELRSKVGSVSDETVAGLTSPDSLKRLVDKNRVENLSKQSTEILDILSRYTVVTATPRREVKNFIVASNPVIRLTNSAGKNLLHDSVELWTTLTPKVAVGLVKKPDGVLSFQLNDDLVRHLNFHLFNQSSATASSEFALLNSLVNSR